MSHMQYGLGMGGAAIEATLDAISKQQQSVIYTMEARIAANKSQTETALAGASATQQKYNEDATATEDSAIGSFVGAGASTLCLVGSGAALLSAQSKTDDINLRTENNDKITNEQSSTPPTGTTLTRTEANAEKVSIDQRATAKMQLFNSAGDMLNKVSTSAGSYIGAEHKAKEGVLDAASQLFSTAQSQENQIASTETSLMSTFMGNAAANTNLLLTLAQYSAQ